MLRVYIIVLAGAGLLLAALPERAAHAQLGVPDLSQSLPPLPVETSVERRVRRQVEDVVEEATDEVEETILPLGEQLAGQADAVLGTALRTFLADVDPQGHEIERDTLVVLVDTARLAELANVKVRLLARRDLPAIGLTLLTLQKPLDGKLHDLVEELRSSWPGTTVDFNHVYTTSVSGTDTDAGTSVAAEAPSEVGQTALRIGVIDSAVQANHAMLRQSQVIAADFAMHDGARPLTHGTAVASLVATSSGNKATIYSAGVFFQVPGRTPGATTEGIVAAIDWLVAEGVPVMNLSLSGPANGLLEVAVKRAVERGHVVVAAVGNNGPSGEPMYPGAYEPVIGVTAVDRKNKVFRYANRGKHVDFAARGVNVRIADSESGGQRIESGTSMAAPHVAVVIAQLLESGAVAPGAVMSWLIAGAKDLGRKGHDPVYGYGLITRPPVVLSAD